MQTFILPNSRPRSRILAEVAKFLAGLDLGRAWRIDIVPHKAKRSEEQNSYWWGVVVAEFVKRLDGWDKDDVHQYLCGEHFGWATIEGLGRKRVKPIRTSSKLSKAEFCELVATAQRIGAQHNIYIPDPNEVTHD